MDPWAEDVLDGLNDANPNTVAGRKFSILFTAAKIVISGRYSHATPFLREYGQLCYKKKATYETVNQLFLDFKEGRLPVWEDPISPACVVCAVSPSSPPRNKRERDADDDAASTKRSRKCTSTSSS